MAGEQKYSRQLATGLHILVWVSLFLLPLLFTIGETVDIRMIFRRTWLPLIFSAIIFYSNYLFLIEKFLFRKQILGFVFWNTLSIICFISLTDFIKSCYPVVINIQSPAPSIGKGFMIYKLVFSYLVTIGFSIAVKISQRWLIAENDRKAAANEQLQSELTYLQYQLQPHFFFNALNNIYALVDVSPSEAKDNIHSLAKLMRYMLYEARGNKVLLSKEIEFLHRFIDLMRVRLTTQTTVHVNFPSDTGNIEIAPFMFISLVENAFKHGVSAISPTVIRIEMKIQDGQLNFTVENTSVPKSQEDKSGSGIGLKNLQKRLDLMYEGKHTFVYGNQGNMFVASLNIQL